MSQKDGQTKRFQRDLPASHETSVLVPTFPILLYLALSGFSGAAVARSHQGEKIRISVLSLARDGSSLRFHEDLNPRR